MEQRAYPTLRVVIVSDQRTYQFHRDEKSWVHDQKVFVDMCRPMPDGSLALLETRQHLRRDDAETLWKNLLRSGFQKVPAVWGPDAEP